MVGKNWTIHLSASAVYRRGEDFICRGVRVIRDPRNCIHYLRSREVCVHARYYAPAFSAEHVLRRTAINGHPRAST